ncbi:hypothetical protein GORHZ_188_00050 [Gordonia rhizosphera NBRC 16068]|uniref:HNH endonuclease n=1 Tax=Gordonia rhizosphera NBRC 16068 TaxID=1108045 RepID=K6X1N8_9ACTN|nr:hypothetical protein GORHZ_188_00050 [Gordonia rhizosphera NBRC 16068]
MSTPRFNDPSYQKAGTMVRGALWLMTEVGEGNTFTKEQLRLAFPGVSQIDRRVRDLRDYGWVIRSNTEDASLRPDEQRLVRAGLRVWEPSERRKGGPAALTGKERRAVFERDGYQCVVCGIAGGETYLDREYETAVLSASKRSSAAGDADALHGYVTECRRCKAGDSVGQPVDIDILRANIRALPADDLHRLRRWVERGNRGPTPLDRAWTAYRQLPAGERDRIAQEIG